MRKSVLLTFEKDVEVGGAKEGKFSVEVELKTKQVDDLFRGLEQAKMSGIKF